MNPGDCELCARAGHRIEELPCAMLHKCANPECANQYKYFSEGLLFEFQVDRDNNYMPLTVPAAGERRREIFWLCDNCSRRLTLECRAGSVAVAPASASRKTA